MRNSNNQPERRKHSRKSLHLSGQLLLPGYEPHDIIIEDFSDEGLFVALSNNGPLKNSSQGSIILSGIVKIVSTSSYGLIELTVDIVRSDRGSFGGKFIKLPDKYLAILNSVAEEQAQAKKYKEPEALAPEVLDDVAQISHHFLKNPMRNFLDQLSDEIFHHAQQASSNTEESELLAAQTLLDKNKGYILNQFISELQNSITSILKPPQENTPIEVDAMRLVDDSELNEWLVSSIIANKAHHVYQEVLYGIQQRFSYLLGHHLEDVELPSGPAMLAKALQRSLTHYEMSPLAKNILYDLFRQFIITQLNQFYQQINQLLIDQNILPVLPKKAANKGADYRQNLLDNNVDNQTVTSNKPSTANEQPVDNEPSIGTKPSNSNIDIPSQKVAGFEGESGAISKDRIAQTQTEQTYINPDTPLPQVGVPTHAANDQYIQNDVANNTNAVDDTAPGIDDDASHTPTTQPHKNTPVATAVAGVNADAANPKALSGASSATKAQPQQKFRNYSNAVHGSANKAMRSIKSMFSLMPSTQPHIVAGAGQVAASQQDLVESIPSIDPLTCAEEDKVLRQEIIEAVAKHYDKPADSIVLSDNDYSIVEFVEQFFNALNAHDDISRETKKLLQYLEVPMVLQLLKEHDFLDDNEHPARQFIDKLSHLGRTGVVLSRAQIEVLEEIVTTTAQSAVTDPAAFSNGLSQLEKLSQIQLDQYQRNLKRTLEGIKGQDKLETAKRDFIKVLALKFSQKYIPHIVLSLLDAGWANLTINRILKKGIENKESQQCISVLEQISLSLMTPEKPDIRLEAMLNFVQKGLDEINGETQSNKHYVQLLQRSFELKNKSPSQTPRAALLERLDFKPDTKFTTLINKQPSKVDYDENDSELSIQRWTERAKKLSLGDWIIRKELNGTSRELKLVWIGEEHYKYVFINHHGLKVLDISLEDLTEKLKYGEIVIKRGESKSVINDALDGLVQNVYNKLAHQATHDQLTGLLNRKEFERKINRRLIPGQTAKGQSIMHVKINDFDVVSQSCSFEGADEMLCEIADLITDNLPRDVISARMGDQSFAVFFDAVQHEEVNQYANSLIQLIKEFRFHFQDKVFSVGFAIGIHSFEKTTLLAEDLIKNATTASDGAYSGGRNRIRMYEESAMDAAQTEKDLRWISQINNSMLDQRITLTGQRIENVVKDPISGRNQAAHYEILMSIVSDSGKRMSPVEFITAAEKFKRIAEVDRWVIGHVFEWMNSNPETLKQIGGCAINVSGFSLNDETFIEYVMEQIALLKVPREHICFEVTETAAISNLSEAADFMYEVKDYGCRFSLDDFGSGLSSYQYLKNLPVDYIKIDGAFINDITEDQRDYAMVKSITELGHYLDKKVIAERVETVEQMLMLKEIGVDFVQGWHIGKPQPLDKLTSTASSSD